MIRRIFFDSFDNWSCFYHKVISQEVLKSRCHIIIPTSIVILLPKYFINSRYEFEGLEVLHHHIEDFLLIINTHAIPASQHRRFVKFGEVNGAAQFCSILGHIDLNLEKAFISQVWQYIFKYWAWQFRQF